MTENKRFERIYADVDVFCRDHNAKGISQLIEKEDYDKIVDLLNALHKENQHFKEAFEKTMEDAFDRNMDSKIAEEVIDYIHISFYEFLKLEDFE